MDRHVASRLRFRRREAGVTQDMLAKVAGVSFQQLQKYEEGTNRITANALYQLAITLELLVQ